MNKLNRDHLEPGCETIEAGQVIRGLVSYLREHRIQIALTDRNDYLGNTVLIDFDSDRLRLDRPPHLSARPASVRANFVHKDRLHHFFTVPVAELKDDVLEVSLPDQIFRIQRRSHYRVDVPMGSSVSFAHKDRVFENFAVRNVSAGGLLLCVQSERRLLKGAKLADLDLALLLFNSAETFSFKVRQAEIVRIADEESDHHCYGASLQLTPREEDILCKYVRRRECELLAKGMC
ncbi:MAG: hypothetical protein P8Y63_14870 [Deltaproteobacteria bacterium]|jgi:c-di-GMP-binding flagellar brake protein YcgR